GHPHSEQDQQDEYQAFLALRMHLHHLPTATTRLLIDQSPAGQPGLHHVQRQYHQGNGVAGPDVDAVPAHTQNFTQTAHDIFSSASRTQRVLCSRCSTSRRMRMNRLSVNRASKPSTISRSGSHISTGMAGFSVSLTVARWCRVFHQFTEYLMIGMFTVP